MEEGQEDNFLLFVFDSDFEKNYINLFKNYIPKNNTNIV